MPRRRRQLRVYAVRDEQFSRPVARRHRERRGLDVRTRGVDAVLAAQGNLRQSGGGPAVIQATACGLPEAAPVRRPDPLVWSPPRPPVRRRPAERPSARSMRSTRSSSRQPMKRHIGGRRFSDDRTGDVMCFAKRNVEFLHEPVGEISPGRTALPRGRFPIPFTTHPSHITAGLCSATDQLHVDTFQESCIAFCMKNFSRTRQSG